MSEGLKVHRCEFTAPERDDLVVKSLQDVHLSPKPATVTREFSGGQRQRHRHCQGYGLRPKIRRVMNRLPRSMCPCNRKSLSLLRELQEKTIWPICLSATICALCAPWHMN